MLARVTARSLRFSSGSVHTILLPSFSRSYAKHNRPKKPSDYRPPHTLTSENRHGHDAERSAGPLGSATGPSIAASRLGSKYQPTTSTSQDASGAGETPHSGLKQPVSSSIESTEGTSGASHSRLPNGFGSPQQEQQKFRPLPDLTQGIPSTLDSELAEAARVSSKGLNVAGTPAEASAGGRGGDDLPKTTYISSIERRKNRLANYMYASFLGLSLVGTIYLGRNWDTEEEEKKHSDAPSGWGFGLFYNRANARLADILDHYNEPSFPRLLPNPDPAWERPYTLVLSLEDLLVHSEWTREHGWRMAKRPGVDYFLRYLNQYYELVIFTSVPSMIGDPIVRKLDPFRIVMWPLFREATRFKKGEYIKVGSNVKLRKHSTNEFVARTLPS